MKTYLLVSRHLLKKFFAPTLVLLVSFALTLGGLTDKAQAQSAVQPHNSQQQQSNTEQTSDSMSMQEVTEQVTDFIQDVRGFVEQDLFGSFNQILQRALGALKIPDLGDVVEQIMKAETLPDEGKTASQLENNLPNSYAIRDDIARATERTAAIGVAQGSALSKQAQQKSAQTLQASTTAKEESESMAEDSESSDTSQQILRNISVQLKANAEIADLQMQEALQARQERALSLTLEAQAAKQLNEANIRERQQAIAERNGAALQSGLLSVPGGVILDNESAGSSN